MITNAHDAAQEIRDEMLTILPDDDIRRMVLNVFADSIELANEGDPRSWSLATLTAGGMKLQVGPYKLLEIASDKKLYLLLDAASPSPKALNVFQEFKHIQAKEPRDELQLARVLIPADDLADTLPDALPALHSLILRVRRSVSQKWHHHSQDALQYLIEETGRELPPSPHLTDAEISIQQVRAAMEAAYPKSEVRRFLLNVLVDSIELADQGVPESWTLTFLNKKNIRLTVGPNSTFYLGQQEGHEKAPVSFSIDLDALSGEDAALAQQLKTYDFHRPAGAISVRLPIDQVHELLQRFLPAHHALIEQTRSGKAVGGADTPQAVIEYIERETGRTLPRPQVRARLSEGAQQVKSVIESVLSDPETRTALLEYLADTIEYAHSCNPNVWVLSFRDSKELRLITGPTRTVTVHGRGLFVTVMDEHLPAEQEEQILAFDERWTHKNLKASHNLQIPKDRVIKLLPAIRQSNFAAIRVSSEIMSRSIYRKSHTPGAVEYLEHELGRTLPHPIYEPSASRAWKISVGNARSRLDEALRFGIIGMDFEHISFDLTDLPIDSVDAYQKALVKRGLVRDLSPNRAPMQLWMLRSEMRVGDRVYLYSPGFFHSRGVVIGDYVFDGTATDFPHRRTVKWEALGEVPLESLPTTLSNRIREAWATLEELTEVEADRIDVLMAGEEAGDADNLDAGQPTPWQQTYARIFPAAGLHYTPWQQATFFTALQTKGFVILSGISGTGKTKIAQAFAAALPQPEQGRNVEFLTVRPDWRDSKSLIGYHNPITDSYQWTPFLSFLLRAKTSWEQKDGLAWFVILDEMNLAHVEHYFAELLSVLESGRDHEGWTVEAIQLPTSSRENAPPASIKLPPNLFLIGTVNLDETTHAFSPKVLDRAFAMEFSDVSFEHYEPGMKYGGAAVSDRDRRGLLHALSSEGAFPRIDRAAAMDLLAADNRPRQWLDTLNALLRPHHMHFGFRVFDEIVAFVDLGLKNGLFDALDPNADPLVTAFDAAVLMKVLPKFHGSRSRLEGPLTKVLAWCFNPDQLDLPVIQGCLSQHPTPDEIELALHALQYRFPATAKRATRLLWTTYVDGFAAFG